MSIETTRPTSTVVQSGTDLFGAANRHTALSDDSDTSYVQWTGADASIELGCGLPTIPSGALVRDVRVRVRASKILAGGQGRVQIDVGDARQNVSLSTLSAINPTTLAVFSDARNYEANPLTVRFSRPSPGKLIPLRLFEVYVDTTFLEKPILASIDGPAGTINGSIPQVRFTPGFDVDGGPGTHYEIRFFDQATFEGFGFDPDISTPVFATGVVARDMPNGALVDGLFPNIDEPLIDGDYRCYIRVAETVHGQLHWSAWGYTAFTVDAIGLDYPVTVSTTANNDQGRILIDLDSSWPGVLLPGGAYELQRLTFDGWKPVRSSPVLPNAPELSSPATTFDYEAPNGVEVTYRARGIADIGDNKDATQWQTATGEWSDHVYGWLKHSADPLLNVRAKIISYPGHASQARQALHQPLGGTRPIISADTRAADIGTVVMRVEDETELAAVETLVGTRAPILLQAQAGTDQPDRYVAVSDFDVVRDVDNGGFPSRRVSLSWTEVSRPQGRLSGYQLFLGPGVYLG